MPQSLTKILIHTVFSTKDRLPSLRELEIRGEMHSMLGGTAKKLDCVPIIVGGPEDHVHLLTTLSRKTEAADFVKEVKRVTSIWVKERDAALSDFYWQAGYGCFSIGQSQVEDVCGYIANQGEHHRKLSFKDEFRSLLKRYELDHDERYVWN